MQAFIKRDWLKLHDALGLFPWSTSPLDVTSRGGPPDWMSREVWDEAQALRRELEAAAKATA